MIWHSRRGGGGGASLVSPLHPRLWTGCGRTGWFASSRMLAGVRSCSDRLMESPPPFPRPSAALLEAFQISELRFTPSH